MYTEGATAPGAWTRRLRLPGIPLETVRDILAALAEQTSCPVDAAAECNATGGVVDLLLHRHPSRTHGTPGVAECDAMADVLLVGLQRFWQVRHLPALEDGLLAFVGLVEGYAPDAPRRDPGVLLDHLPRGARTWSYCRVQLLSARPLPGGVRWHDEPGVVIHAAADLLPAITATAAALRQERFIVTDHAARRTYVLHRHREGTR